MEERIGDTVHLVNKTVQFDTNSVENCLGSYSGTNGADESKLYLASKPVSRKKNLVMLVK